MLTLSREALVKIKKDAWQVDSIPLLCFGYLLGSYQQDEIVAALPLPNHLEIDEEADLETVNGAVLCLQQHLALAKAFAEKLDLDVMGIYCTTGLFTDFKSRVEIFGEFTQLEYLLVFYRICCSNCSGPVLFSEGARLERRVDYFLPKGIRSAMGVNQKKVLRAWFKHLAENVT